MLKQVLRLWSALGISPALAVAALGLAYATKLFYSQAGADQLLWVIAPSSWLAKYVGGLDLVYERGGGFISHTHHIVVGPACAGVNFLVVCHLTLFFSFARHFRKPEAWLMWSAVLAYFTTVATNGLRIFVSAQLFDLDIYGGQLTPQGVHRWAGTAIYYGSLMGVYLAVERIVKANTWRLAPFFWYLLISLGVPALGRAYQSNPGQFAVHGLQVLAIGLLLTAMVVLPKFILIGYSTGREIEDPDR